MYLETVKKKCQTFSKNVQEKYMELCQVFIAKGCEEVCDVILAKVSQLDNSIALRDKVSIAEVEDVFQCLIKSLASSLRPRKCLSRLGSAWANHNVRVIQITIHPASTGLLASFHESRSVLNTKCYSKKC